MRAALPGRVALSLCVAMISSVATDAAPKNQESSRLRRDLDALQRAVENSVSQVARPAGGLVGLHGGRAYRLQGAGIVVVLSPRILPAPRRASLDPQVARALDEALNGLQESLKRAGSPEDRAEIQRSMEQLRETRIRLVNRPGQPMRLLVPPQMEAEVAAMNAHAEQFRREAEQAQREAERELEQHLRAMNGELALTAEPPTAPETPAAPPAPGAPPAPPAPAAAPAPPEGPALLVGEGDRFFMRPPDTTELMLAPLPPAPWDFWFSVGGESDDRSADEVVGAVRDAVASALSSHRGPWSSLSDEESVSVAVDFVPRRGPDAPRTLVLRVKGSDLAARLGGKIDEAELRRRLHSAEY